MTTEIKSLMRKNNKPYTIRANRDRVFYTHEWKIFFDSLKDYQKLFFKALLLTGARINELRNVKLNDIDFSNQRMIIRVTKGRFNPETNSKKSKTRTIRISSELCRDIKKLNLNSEDYIFHLTTAAANISMKKALQKAGIQDWQMFSIHNIRKTSETWSLALGIDSLLLSKRFGHNMITMYEHYSQSDVYTFKEKDEIKSIFGDTYSNI